MTNAHDLPSLGPNGRDRTAAFARALAGMVPIAGSLIAELITEVVPGQRLERIEYWLRHLVERLASVEEAALRERLRKRENVALFEEGAYQATRAISEERRRQIAELVAGGIADDRRDYVESLRLLRLLGELDDGEVIILAGYLQKNRDGDYRARHANVLRDLAVHLGSSRDEIDADTVRKAGRQHLVRLGLLDQGALGGDASIQLNRLGRLLLRRIGLAGDDDW
ncbi:MAG: hypothetical protein ACRECF_12515 [Methyloceanibacter sp.]